MKPCSYLLVKSPKRALDEYVADENYQIIREKYANNTFLK